jgi:ubiquinone/menaquinone biosynthesis C-methylase UbiE
MSTNPSHPSHQSLIDDQFSRQAALFANSPELHDTAMLQLLVDAAHPQPGDDMLDIACGPGSVVAAFAPHARRVVGLDATAAMLDQSRALAAARGLGNVEWRQGDVYALPFADASFGIVSCRFAFHHLEYPARAFAEMVRVCRPGGRIVLCDGLASDDPAKAAAFNAMELHRDPSTVAFRPLGALVALFAGAGLPVPSQRLFQVPYEIEAMIAKSFPANEDRILLRRMIEDSVEGDRMGMNARREGGTIRLAYPAAVLVAAKPA